MYVFLFCFYVKRIILFVSVDDPMGSALTLRCCALDVPSSNPGLWILPHPTPLSHQFSFCRPIYQFRVDVTVN